MSQPIYIQSTIAMKLLGIITVVLLCPHLAKSAIKKSEKQAILSSHNNYRSTLSGTIADGTPLPQPITPLPSLSWNSKLASTAAGQADSCVYGHEEHYFNGKKVGQNIYSCMSSSGICYGDGSPVVDFWYSEVSQYKWEPIVYGAPTNTGHFTQIIWETTTHVGCAVANCPFGYYIVCHYNPAGNVDGLYPYLT